MAAFESEKYSEKYLRTINYQGGAYFKFIRLTIKWLSLFGVSPPSSFASFGGMKTCFGWMQVVRIYGDEMA